MSDSTRKKVLCVVSSGNIFLDFRYRLDAVKGYHKIFVYCRPEDIMCGLDLVSKFKDSTEVSVRSLSDTDQILDLSKDYDVDLFVNSKSDEFTRVVADRYGYKRDHIRFVDSASDVEGLQRKRRMYIWIGLD